MMNVSKVYRITEYDVEFKREFWKRPIFSSIDNALDYAERKGLYSISGKCICTLDEIILDGEGIASNSWDIHLSVDGNVYIDYDEEDCNTDKQYKLRLFTSSGENVIKGLDKATVEEIFNQLDDEKRIIKFNANEDDKKFRTELNMRSSYLIGYVVEED